MDMNAGLLGEGGENSKQIRMLHERINRLEIFDRAIILLWLENQSYDEIAAIVGISVKNVSVRLLRIKKKLMEMSND
jgi:RNA polymerase sigma-70 factor (ECF subfamily)